MKQILLISLLMVVIIFGIIYFTSSMASLDAGVDVQGSNYEDAYDASSEAAITNLNIMSLITYILAVAALVAAIAIARRSAS